MPLYASLLSIPLTTDYAPLPMAPEQHKQQTLHALLTTLLRIAAQPVLFVMEDLHWVDPSTLEFLSFLVDQGPTARILAPPLSSRLQPTLDRAFAPHAGDATALAAAPGCRDGRPGRARQDAAGRGHGAGRDQDRWGAAVRGGVDQDGAGVGLLRSEERYELTGPLPPLAIPPRSMTH